MSDVFFHELDIRLPDYNLGIGGGTHGQNTGRMLEAIESTLKVEKPDLVLVYGDTDSTLAGTLAAVKLHYPVAHIEAGLRSYNRIMPEEINRVLSDHAADILFTPSQTAVNNLEREGICGKKVCLVGDVMYDASLFYREFARKPAQINHDLENSFILCTIHRAENTDDPNRLNAILTLLNKLAQKVNIVFPLHPRTLAAVNRMDGLRLIHEVYVIEPVGFLEMNWLLANCQIVLTDSGGLQKEAYFHSKPCVTLRDETEWVELVDAGWNLVINPTDVDLYFKIDEMRKKIIPQGISIYGDGNAAKRIIQRIC
jgi:UDP-GlcNAc3NAcA epimerase